MIVGDGARFNYLVDVVLDVILDVVKFLRSFQYGLYAIIITSQCLLQMCYLTLSTTKK